MMIATVSALTCPACGGPLGSRSTQRCQFCGVALVGPVDGDEPFLKGQPAAIRRGIVRLREQLRLDPTRSETHRRLGHAYLELDLTDDAIRALTVAVGLAPEAIPPRLELATLLASRSAVGVPDAYPTAMRHVRQVLNLEAHSTDGLLLLARLLTQRGQYDDARATLSGITDLPEDEVRLRCAWVTLAEAADHDRRGDRRGAVAAWRQAAADAPEHVGPAVESFLARACRDGHAARGRRSRRPSPRIRMAATVTLGAIVTVAGIVALPWPFPVQIAGLALVTMVSGWIASGSMRREATNQRAVRASGKNRPDPELPRLLREAELVAARADRAGRHRQIDWADNLAVALPRR